jgi:hypothetical protein
MNFEMSSGKLGSNIFVDVSVSPRSDEILIEPIPQISIPYLNILSPSYQKAVEIHEFLLKSEHLTNDQKLDFCSVGRHFMKQYLKEILKKVI